MDNRGIATVLAKIADMLELEGDNPFRIRAYRNAADTVRNLPREVEDLIKEDPALLEEIPGIGKDLRAKLCELVETGSLEIYEELERKVPPGVLGLLEIEGLGPKKVQTLRKELDVEDMDGLETACKEGRLRRVKGFGEQTEKKLLASIAHHKDKKGRLLLAEAASLARRVMEHLKGNGVFRRVEFAGSLRRGRETVGDLDILATVEDDEKAMRHFVSFPGRADTVALGPTKASIRMLNGPQVDLRIVEEDSFGAALIYFTGSKAHNVSIRKIAKKKGYRLSEYGLFKVTGENTEEAEAGRTESEVYEKMGMQFIPPEIREDWGEVEDSLRGSVPDDFLEYDDIKGELHVHTEATDGRSSMWEMADAARRRGYRYLAVTDHTRDLRVARGLDGGRLLEEMERTRDKTRGIKGIDVLFGAEVNILKNGELDIDEGVLDKLDLVIAAVHSHFALSAEEQTERVLKAMDKRAVNVLAHPTCRLITRRRAVEMDMEKVFRKAVEKRVYLEINCQPDRMDLGAPLCRRAQELGAKFAVCSDAHEVADLQLMVFPRMTARRGWVRRENVLNTYGPEKLREALAKRIY